MYLSLSQYLQQYIPPFHKFAWQFFVGTRWIFRTWWWKWRGARPWNLEDVLPDDFLCDVDSNDSCPEPSSKQTRTQKLTILVQWLVYFLIMWQSLCKLSDNGLDWLLQFLFQFIKVLSDLSGCLHLQELLAIIPSSLYLLRKYASFDRDNFIKYAVCSKCCKLYNMKDCTEIDPLGRRVIKHCQQMKYARSATWGAPLAKKVVLSNGTEEFYPLKVYCYKRDGVERFNGILSSFKTNNRCIEIQLMWKLLSDHFISSSTLPKEFEENVLPILSHSLKESTESITDIVKLGSKLMNAAPWKEKCGSLVFTKSEVWILMSSRHSFQFVSRCTERP